MQTYTRYIGRTRRTYPHEDGLQCRASVVQILAYLGPSQLSQDRAQSEHEADEGAPLHGHASLLVQEVGQVNGHHLLRQEGRRDGHVGKQTKQTASNTSKPCKHTNKQSDKRDTRANMWTHQQTYSKKPVSQRIRVRAKQLKQRTHRRISMQPIKHTQTNSHGSRSWSATEHKQTADTPTTI